MIYFTSDLHFWHKNAIVYTNRPFGTVEEINEKLIEYWNKTIHQNEEVYILGDVTMVRPARANCKGKNSRAIPYCGILCHGGWVQK